MNDMFGATVTPQGVDFKVWAPAAERVDLIIHDRSGGDKERLREIPMRPNADRVFEAHVPDLRAGTIYQYGLNGKRRPDPYSRFQPEGPHGPSLVVDPNSYRWKDGESQTWRREFSIKGQILYELHVGTFTEAGTFDAAAERLRWLKSMGITVIEVMPIAEFPGRFNWGYDGVDLFATFHGYGDHDAFKRFVDAAHRMGLAVILDVVYNHVGPSGNYLTEFSANYFAKHLSNDWGTPFNVDGQDNRFVRKFIVDNACYWVREFHLDGLRLDATTNIPDTSDVHVLAELSERVRETASPNSVVLIAEDEQQQATRLLPNSQGGFGIDAMWNDDFHHTAQVALRGRRHAYLNDYKGSAQEFVSAAKYGFLFQGQYYFWQKQPRGQRVRTPMSSMIAFLDNHDQIANSLFGLRSHQETSAAKYRALTAVMLLSPQTPMLFMGQEFGAESPFLYFADHEEELGRAVVAGRKAFLEQFPGFATPDALEQICDPGAETTFQRSKLAWNDAERNTSIVALHRDLIALRNTDPVLNEQSAAFDGAVLNEHAFIYRWFSDAHGDRLLVVNLTTDFQFEPGPEPLLAPSPERYWDLLWSSARLKYGGGGVELPEVECGWRIPGESAILLCERPVRSAIETQQTRDER